jgi:hypothetical protein
MSLDAWTLGFALFALAWACAAWQARRENHERRDVAALGCSAGLSAAGALLAAVL